MIQEKNIINHNKKSKTNKSILIKIITIKNNLRNYKINQNINKNKNNRKMINNFSNTVILQNHNNHKINNNCIKSQKQSQRKKIQFWIHHNKLKNGYKQEKEIIHLRIK
jgi:hypothetical protein